MTTIDIRMGEDDEKTDAYLRKSRDNVDKFIQSWGTNAIIKSLLKKSKKRGMDVKPRDVMAANKKLVRDSNARELTPLKRTELTAALTQQTKNMTLVDAFETAKQGGGSSGVRRYELLFEAKSGLLHLELKTQPTPAQAKVATAPIPACAPRIQQTLDLEQGRLASPFYQVIEIDHQPMLLRPRYYGNKSAKLKPKAKHTSDNLDLIAYEAFVLGKFHARSVAMPQQWATAVLAFNAWSGDAAVLARHFVLKYSDLQAEP